MSAVQNKTSSLRIIGGEWRSRRLDFPLALGLRPTPNRVRETLFNWLSSIVPGANCLDLFAGSGALSFEALSRGAARAVIIDANPNAITYLQANAEKLKAIHAHVYKLLAPNDLHKINQSITQFDLVFLDPPFHQQLIQPCCAWLEENEWLKKNAYIYIEAEADLKILPIPSNWQIRKHKKAGQVDYYLCQRT